MEGDLLLRIILNFVNEVGKLCDLKIHQIIYDWNSFGNYQIVFCINNSKLLTINCDRDFLSVFIKINKKESKDYFKLLSEYKNEKYFDCNSIENENRLIEILNNIKNTIIDMLNILTKLKDISRS
jgi:hypothetical protein